MRDVIILAPHEVVELRKSKGSSMPHEGTALDTKKEWKTAHRMPPKSYRNTKAGDIYADEEGHRYPIGDAAHVRNAAARLADPKNASVFPDKKLKLMWSRIRKQARKLGVELSGTKKEHGTKTKGN